MGRPPGSRNKTTKPPKAATFKIKKPRKNKTPKAQATASESSEAADKPKMPNENQAVALARRMDSFLTQSKELGETKKDVIDKAVETQHFNRAALGAALAWRRRAKKDPAKFSLEFSHFLFYVECLKLDQIANENRGLPLDDGGDDGQIDLEEAIEAVPSTGRLRIVPGAAAPEAEVPPAPSDEEAA